MKDVQEVQVSRLHGGASSADYKYGTPFQRLVFYWQKRHFLSGVISFMALFLFSYASLAALKPISDQELSQASARANLPTPLLDDVGFNLSAAGIEVDLDVQADIGAIEWIDDDGIGTEGSLILKGVHIGGFDGEITQEMVRSNKPFASTDLAMIRGMLVQADPEAGTLITINQLGIEPGQGIDIIVNDIYFGQDLSLNRDVNGDYQRGWGLLIEDLSNFASDDYVNKINNLFGLKLSTLDDGFNSEGGNYYPIQVSMLPLNSDDGFDDRDSLLDFLPDFDSETAMHIEAEFMVHIKKLAVYKTMDNGNEFEMGIEGLMLYQGLDTTGDGIEDTIGPATTSMTMQTIPHQLSDGSTVQAMHFSNINLKTDIAMANIYIGNSQTGSLGAFHIDNLEIKDTQMWIYPH